MKRFFIGLGRFLRKFWGILFAIAAGIYVCVAIFEPELRAPMIVATVVCAGLAWLLLRKKRSKAEPVVSDQPAGGINVSFASQEVPADILRDMRKTYTKAQAIRDAEIMRESFLLAQRTLDFDVFFMRAELSMQKAFTLLQAEQAKCKGVAALNLSKGAHSVIETNTALKIDFLDRAVDAEIKAAVKLKTPKSQSKRLEAFLNKLSVYEDEFCVIEENYNSAVAKVRNMIAQIEKAGEV